ncbi:histidine kinase [Empedobacter falsenii]
MNKNQKIVLIIFSIIFTFIFLLIEFNVTERAYVVESTKGLGKIIGYLSRFLILGLIIYKFVKGIIVSDKKLILRNTLILFVVNILVYSIIFFTSPNITMNQFFHPEALKYFVGYFSFSIAASFVNTSVFNDFKKNDKQIDNPKSEIWKYFVQSIVFTQLLYFVFVNFDNLFFIKKVFYSHWINYFLVGIITIIFLLFFYFLERRRYKLETKIVLESTKAETATANFETLKNQLDPHFLFNSLNVLTGLIEENPANAIDFTTSLSKIYRYVLEQKDKEVVPIQEEINFAKTYVKLLKLRFENSIDFEIEQTTFFENEFIVPLSLQILLENTIKHNVVSEQKPLKIKIYKRDDSLIVENSFQPKDSIKESTRIGLKNIINRYQLISNREVNIEKNQEVFQVQLPILTQKNNSMNAQSSVDEEQIAYQRALSRAKELKEYYNTVITIVLGNVFLFFVNYLTSPEYWWFYYVFIGSVISILVITFNVFGISKKWEERKAKEIYKKEQNKKWQ